MQSIMQEENQKREKEQNDSIDGRILRRRYGIALKGTGTSIHVENVIIKVSCTSFLHKFLAQVFVQVIVQVLVQVIG